jgi:hypothetical protein
MVRPNVGFERSAALQIGIVAGEAELIVAKCREARAQAIFEPDQAFDRDPGELIIVRSDRRSAASDFDVREGGPYAEPHIGRPAIVLPAIHNARENLVEAVGELHDIERTADAIPGPDGNAVARA